MEYLQKSDSADFIVVFTWSSYIKSGKVESVDLKKAFIFDANWSSSGKRNTKNVLTPSETSAHTTSVESRRTAVFFVKTGYNDPVTDPSQKGNAPEGRSPTPS
eukprot:501585-Prymnesium_polylepis.1